jgi:crotonobetainyl-CoA:carnitine CoA-transferase CaiB-like acyl-CoA transferase
VTTSLDADVPENEADLPLNGVRILDLSMVWAGPFATKHLVDLGAEVIKIEGPARLDHVRTVSVPDRDVAEPYNNSRYFNEYNRSKLGMAIDMRQPAGKQIVQRLAAISDVLIENFRPGVIDRLGLSYESLKRRNPRIIMVSLPAYSDIEPERGIPGYGPNVEQMSGIAYLSGYEDGPPQKFGISYGDPVAGLGGAAAVLMALVHRERTGVGQRINGSQRNMLLGFIGDAIIAHQLGHRTTRTGNRSRLVAPQGAYPSLGEDGSTADAADSWVAISVVTDAHWVALCRTIARTDLLNDGRYSGVESRHAAHDELDRLIAQWTAGRTARAAADALQAAGVPASPVLTPDGLRDDPHLMSREFLRTVPHSTMKPMKLTAPTWHFRGLDRQLRAAPKLGEHNHLILSELLGYSDSEISELEIAGVIGSRPVVHNNVSGGSPHD